MTDPNKTVDASTVEQETLDVSTATTAVKKTWWKQPIVWGVVAVAACTLGAGGYYGVNAYMTSAAKTACTQAVSAFDNAQAQLDEAVGAAGKLVEAATAHDLDAGELTALLNEAQALPVVAKECELADRGELTTAATALTSATDARSDLAGKITTATSSLTNTVTDAAKTQLDKTLEDARASLEAAEHLYTDTEGKVADDQTREQLKTATDALKDAISNASDTKSNDSAPWETIDTQTADIHAAIKQVNTAISAVKDSKTAKDAADAEAQTAAANAGIDAGTYTGWGYSNAYAGGYVPPANVGGTTDIPAETTPVTDDELVWIVGGRGDSQGNWQENPCFAAQWFGQPCEADGW